MIEIWEREHQAKEKKIKPHLIKPVDDVEIIHSTVERDFVLVVVLAAHLNCDSLAGVTGFAPLMERNLFTDSRAFYNLEIIFKLLSWRN